jgi:hypothetical protein
LLDEEENSLFLPPVTGIMKEKGQYTFAFIWDDINKNLDGILLGEKFVNMPELKRLAKIGSEIERKKEVRKKKQEMKKKQRQLKNAAKRFGKVLENFAEFQKKNEVAVIEDEVIYFVLSAAKLVLD